MAHGLDHRRDCLFARTVVTKVQKAADPTHVSALLCVPNQPAFARGKGLKLCGAIEFPAQILRKNDRESGVQ